MLTLSHEIFQMMPLDIVGQIANIDTTVLLGRIADVLHHVFFGYSTFFESRRGAVTVATTVS